jgi:hypothetical protein
MPEGAQFCPSCGQKAAPVPAQPSGADDEEVYGVVLFKGYQKELCFTEKRIISFETMRDRYKFLFRALGPLPMVVDRTTKIGDVLPFLKSEIPRSEVWKIEVKDHGRFSRGHIRVTKRTRQVVDLARIEVDVDKKAFGDLAELVNSIYPEVAKTIE